MTDAKKAAELDRFPVWEYNLGDVVYLKLRDERLPGMVTAVFLRPGGVSYEVSWGTGGSGECYAIELSRECEL